MKKIVILLMLFSHALIFAQNEASNWYFGYGAGMSFDLGSGTINVNDDGQLSTNEGCSTISDNQGNLLFYSDGITVWNRNHTVMQNGNGLFGDPSSTQSAIIVPKPQDPDIYYIFTVDNSLDGNNFGFNYSEVDITLDGGLGGVTNKNINLLALCSEKISAVLKDCIENSIWVITFASVDGTTTAFDTFHAFEVNPTGVVTTSITSTVPTTATDIRGYMKLSPDGTKLANASMANGIFLYDFDSDTGLVNNELQLQINSASPRPYGVEFSPSSQFLYIHSSNDAGATDPAANHQSTLTQYDVTAADIQSTEFTIDQSQLYRGGLQLGPDGKIYRALSENYFTGIPFLGVINNPNEQGLDCNYVPDAVNLAPNLSSQGLPPFIQSFFDEQIDIIQNGVSTVNLDLCNGETYTLIAEDVPGAIYTWWLDGVVLAESDFDLLIAGPGHYEVFVDFNNGDCEFQEGQAFVNYFEVPVANQPSTVEICDDNNDNFWSFDFVNITTEILNGQSPTTFQVSYYLTQDDADNNENSITLPFQNTTNPQQIYARIDNIGYTNCFDTSNFMIEVFDTPTANSVADYFECDDNDDGNDTNGQITTDLSQFSDTVLGSQNPAEYTVTYHISDADAISGNNPLANSFYNTVADTQEIFIRIENNANADCFDTTSFNVVVNPLPESFDTSLFQCDEDGIPDGFTLFNLTEAFDVLSGGAAGVSAKYYTSLTDAEDSNNEVDGNAFFNFVNPQTIYVQIIDNGTGCFSIAELLLEVSATAANDAELIACDDDGTEDGFYEFTLADADSTVLNGLPAGITISYYETYEDALLESNVLGTTYTNTTAYSQTIYVRAENDNACYGINEITLTVNELPNIEIEEERIYCLNFFPETITLTGGVIGDSPNNYLYDWSTGETTTEIDVNSPGVYTVIVTNVLGCSKLRTITVLPSNIATFESIDIDDGGESGTITINVSGEGDYEYALDNPNGPYQDSNVFTEVAPGFHTVYVRDKNECGIVEELISVIGFPKFFTPNNDSYFDTWQVYGVDDQFQSGSKILIFDRYGKLLKQIDPKGRGWDGTFNGSPMPDNDYWFHVTLEDGRLYTNHFALRR